MDPRGQEEEVEGEEGRSWSIPGKREAGGLQKGQEEGGKIGEIHEQREATKKVAVPISPYELWGCIHLSFIVTQ